MAALLPVHPQPEVTATFIGILGFDPAAQLDALAFIILRGGGLHHSAEAALDVRGERLHVGARHAAPGLQAVDADDVGLGLGAVFRPTGRCLHGDAGARDRGCGRRWRRAGTAGWSGAWGLGRAALQVGHDAVEFLQLDLLRLAIFCHGREGGGELGGLIVLINEHADEEQHDECE